MVIETVAVYRAKKLVKEIALQLSPNVSHRFLVPNAYRPNLRSLPVDDGPQSCGGDRS
jgi:hypothetical protein